MNDIINTNTTTIKYQCRHIFTDGHRCASPCLRHEHFCYYHHTTRKPIANPQQRRSRRTTFHLPLPEDRSAILQSIGEVLQRIAANNIDPRRAGLLLYGLQIACAALPKDPKEPATTSRHTRSSRDESPATPQTVEDITLDPTHGILAPRAELITPESRPSFTQQLIQHLKNSKPEIYNQPQPETWEPTPSAEAPTEPPTEPEILPTLQAKDESATPTPPTQNPLSRPKAKRQRRDPRISRLLLPSLNYAAPFEGRTIASAVKSSSTPRRP